MGLGFGLGRDQVSSSLRWSASSCARGKACAGSKPEVEGQERAQVGEVRGGAIAGASPPHREQG